MILGFLRDYWNSWWDKVRVGILILEIDFGNRLGLKGEICSENLKPESFRELENMMNIMITVEFCWLLGTILPPSSGWNYQTVKTMVLVSLSSGTRIYSEIGHYDGRNFL